MNPNDKHPTEKKTQNPDLVPPELQRPQTSESSTPLPNPDLVPPDYSAVPPHGQTPYRGNGGDRPPVPLFRPDGMFIGPDHPNFHVPGLYPQSPNLPAGPNARFDIIDPINPYGIPDPDEVPPRRPEPTIPQPRPPIRGVEDLTSAPADDPANILGDDPMGIGRPVPKTDPFGPKFGGPKFGGGGPFGGGGGGFPF